MKRNCLLLLLLVLFVSFGNVQKVNAAEISHSETENVQADQEEISFTCINPLYESIIREEDIPSRSNDAALFSEPYYLTSYQEVAEELRCAMENRIENPTLYYAGTGKFSQSVFEQWIEMALSETGVPTQGDYLRWQYGGCNASATITLDGGIYYQKINLNFVYYTTYEEEEYVTGRVHEIIESFGLEETATEYQKIKTVYEYICSHVVYDMSHLSDVSYVKQFTAYAALHDGKAVCQGYANLMYRLLSEMGVRSRIIPGNSNGQAHAWNIAEIRGAFYYLDATWDAGKRKYSYFLKGKNDFPYHTSDSAYCTDAFFSSYPVSDYEFQEPAVLEFEDIFEDDWYYDAVKYVSERDLMTGLNKSTFDPADILSRAQFAVILHRMNGEPEMEYEMVFPDVLAGTWYTDAVLWANDVEVITGYSDGRFGPADYITREQMAVMMYRFACRCGYGENMADDFEGFEDAEKVSDFAWDAMRWAVGNGMISGKYNGTVLDPQGSAARAECATIIMRFKERFGI